MRYRANWRLALDGRVFEAGDILPADLDPPARLVGGVLTMLDDADAMPGDAPPEPPVARPDPPKPPKRKRRGGG